jgi:mono/diheme cytochrome c family protein
LALALSVPLALGAGTRSTSSAPGNAAAGKTVFIAFCGKCHTMDAAGSMGTLGPNLDQDKVTFSAVVSAVEQGVGGIQAEYILRDVTFNQIINVAKFVVTESGCAHGASCQKSSESQ